MDTRNIAHKLAVVTCVFCCGYFIRYLSEPQKVQEVSKKAEATVSVSDTSSRTQSETKKDVVNNSSESETTQSSEYKNDLTTETTITKLDGTVIKTKVVDRSNRKDSQKVASVSNMLSFNGFSLLSSDTNKKEASASVKLEETSKMIEYGKESIVDIGLGISGYLSHSDKTKNDPILGILPRIEPSLPNSMKDFGLSGEIKINPLHLGVQGQIMLDGTSIITIKLWL